MWRRLTNWPLGPSFAGDADVGPETRLLAADEVTAANVVANVFVLSLLVAILVYLGGTAILGDLPSSGVLVSVGVYGAILVVIGVLLRFGRSKIAGFVLVLATWGLCTVLMLQGRGIQDPVVPGYFIVLAAAGLVLNKGGRWVSLLGFGGLSGGALIVAYTLERLGLLRTVNSYRSAPRDLLGVLVLLGLLGFLIHHTIYRMRLMKADLRAKARDLECADRELAVSHAALDAEKARLATRLQAIVAVAQTVAKAVTAPPGRSSGVGAAVPAADLDALLSEFTEAIASELGFPHVAVFWVNPADQSVAIRTASAADMVAVADTVANAENQTLARRSYGVSRAPEDQQRSRGDTLVEAVVADGTARLVPDWAEEADLVPSPGLPDVRSELAIPIRLEGEVIAVLDVWSGTENALAAEDRVLLQSLCRQLSLAISNLRVIEGLRRDVETAERTYRELTRDDWRRLLELEGGTGFVSTSEGTTSTLDAAPQAVGTAAVDDHGNLALAALGGGQQGLAQQPGQILQVPVRVAGQVVAEVQAKLPSQQRAATAPNPDERPGEAAESAAATLSVAWTAEQLALAETLSEQLSQALERARLHRETQRRAVRERVLREISDEMGRASDLESLLRVTAESLGRSLGGSQLYVKLATPRPTSSPGPPRPLGGTSPVQDSTVDDETRHCIGE